MAGIIQLIAKGVEDKYLTNKPEITNFKYAYKRISNFAKDIQRNTFTTEPNFNGRYTCTISKNGDMLNKMTLTFTVPSIELPDNMKFAWVKKVAFAIIKSIELEIGSVLIDKHYGDWLNIWYEIVLPISKRFDRYIGLSEEINNYSNYKKDFIFFIPLTFWFNTFPKLALPLIGLQNQDIKINVDFNSIENCIKILPYINIEDLIVLFKNNTKIYQIKNNKKISKGIFYYHDINTGKMYYECIKGEFLKENGYIYDKNKNYVSINDHTICDNIDLSKYKLKNTFIFCEYIALDKDEKKIILDKCEGDHLISQILYGDEKILYERSNDIPVRYLGLCKEIFWVIQKEDAKKNKNYFDYGLNIKEEQILINSIKRQLIMDSQYYTLIQPYQYHTHTDNKMDIHNYSFALYPENLNPSGIINLQKISNFNFKIKLNKKKRSNIVYFRSYIRVYNIFRVKDGIGSVLFNNNII
ncbi:NCLDV major capsid protein [Hokovirus HKV1]|uniref:NCLDV major capsid protein n=1 Tax=Hokovirus HKV1 TaxID=1977638 RepID=A0A1V0SFY1_9VIRU|nr:NCLDV major capsid protein [Hokovirus HKV1]